MVALDSYGLHSAYSSTLQFGVDLANEAPEPPRLLSPANNEYYSKAVLKFEWEPAEDIDPFDTIADYTIQYTTDVNFESARLITTEKVGTTSYNIQVQTNQVIYWRVSATDARGLTSPYQPEPYRVIVDLTSEPPSDPPTIEDLPDLNIGKNREYRFDLTPYVDDDGGRENLFVVTDRSGVDVENLTLVFNESEEDIFDISVIVSDGYKSNERSVGLHVIVQTNWPPEIGRPLQPLTVDEGENLTDVWRLDEYFVDYDGTAPMEYFATANVKGDLIRINIDPDTHRVDLHLDDAWNGKALITFRAVDQKNAFKEQSITLTVRAMNDRPVVRDQIRDRSVNEGDTWEIDLRNFFTDEEDGTNLTYSCNNDAIEIFEGYIARWKPDEDATKVSDVVFTATDEEGLYASTDPITIKVISKTVLDSTMLTIIVIAAAGVGATLAFLYKYLAGKFEIEEIFLVDKAGLLISHISKKEDSAVDKDLIGSMLTAVLDFVKDSFRSEVKGEESLGKLQYGDATIIIERGDMVVLACVISGEENPRLRTRMKSILNTIEKKYWYVLRDWDGDVDQLQEVEEIIGKLIK